MKLSEHFNLQELTHSDYGVRKKLDNTPSEIALGNLKRLCELLEKVRTLLGDKPMTVKSGYRSYSINLGVGGEATSQHRKGCAADWVHSEFTIQESMKRIVESDIQYDQLILEPNWIHISVPNEASQPPRVQALVKTAKGYDPYIIS